MSFSEKVNAISLVVARSTNDPAERLAIANTLAEIYRFELIKSFVPVKVADQNDTASS